MHKHNAQILNSSENTTLDRWYASRAILKQEQGLGRELLQYYKPSDFPLYANLQSEQKNIEKQLTFLADTIPLFAAYMRLWAIQSKNSPRLFPFARF